MPVLILVEDFAHCIFLPDVALQINTRQVSRIGNILEVALGLFH
jgi:hypothetical protein